MPTEYKLFWFYLITNCDHAGIFKVNLRSFCGLNGVKIDPDTALGFINTGKSRIRVLNNGCWLVEDFFVYQYGTTLNTNNRVHESIVCIYKKYKIKLTSIRGLIDLKDRVKDKDKDIYNTNSYNNTGNKAKAKKIDKNIFGKEFTKDNLFVVLSDGDKQALGKNQKFQLKHDSIRPEEIWKGYIV